MKDIKFAVVIVSGISDIPSDHLDGRTPLEAAVTPNMDSISALGRIGRVETVDMETVGGSERALLSLLGFDTAGFPISRGALEAAGLGIKLSKDDLALRLNFVSTYNDALVDHNGGQISDAEAGSLIKMLNARIGGPKARFYPGLGYRNLLVLKGGRALDFKTVPPHEILHQPVVDFYPYGKDASVVTGLMDRALRELEEHDINLVRIDLGQNPADRIWLWGEGADFDLPRFDSMFPLRGCIVSAVPLLKGIARKTGLHHLVVPGATGYVDTDYEAKARLALEALGDFDLVVVHVSAVNEVCHQGNLNAKVEAIEAVDQRLVGPLCEGIRSFGKWRLMVTSDHITPAEESAPLKWPVPVAFCGHEVEALRGCSFSETNAGKSGMFVEKGHDLMEFFLSSKRS